MTLCNERHIQRFILSIETLFQVKFWHMLRWGSKTISDNSIGSFFNWFTSSCGRLIITVSCLLFLFQKEKQIVPAGVRLHSPEVGLHLLLIRHDHFRCFGSSVFLRSSVFLSTLCETKAKKTIPNPADSNVVDGKKVKAAMTGPGRDSIKCFNL